MVNTNWIKPFKVLITKVFAWLCIVTLQSTYVFGTLVLATQAQASIDQNIQPNAQHLVASSQLNYLLAIDRLDHYVKSLAIFIEGKKSAELVQALNDLKVEDYLRQNFTYKQLSQSTEWDFLIESVLKEKFSSLILNKADLQWNYNFFKNKLLERYRAQNPKIDYSQTSSEVALSNEVTVKHQPVKQVQLSIPKIKGEKILLDFEQYISEKTTRAIIWDATLHQRDFQFHIGTRKDFNDFIKETGVQIIQEVTPYSRNYNKIFLIYHPKTKAYSYIINQISGQDRIKHLIAQLRLIKVNGQSYLNAYSKVKVIGDPNQLHLQVEDKLLDIFQRLPKADKIIMGQKRAFEESLVKQYSVANDNIINQFNYEMPSHEFSDYLIVDQAGRTQRWRFFSAVWGDEAIPIVKAISQSGHKEIIYVGTAGALSSSGLKVGDLVTGDKVLMSNGQYKQFSENDLNLNLKSVRVGQVYSPFQETNYWLEDHKNKIDIVEVETRYILENAAKDVQVKTYFLISDIVGSDTETLASAGKSSTRRKRAQQQLIKAIFDSEFNKQNPEKILVQPKVSNKVYTQELLGKIQEFRKSRETLSQIQLAYALAKQSLSPKAINKTSTDKLIKAYPVFSREELTKLLTHVDHYLIDLSAQLGRKTKIQFFSESVADGTLSPKKNETVLVVIHGFKAEFIKAFLGDRFNQRWEAVFKNDLNIKFVDERSLTKDFIIFTNGDTKNFSKYYEKNVLFPMSYAIEEDPNGNYRSKKVIGIEVLTCKALFR